MSVISIGFGKSLPGHPDSNFMLRIMFDEEPLPGVVKALANVLASAHPVEQDLDGRRITIRTNGSGGDTKIRLARQALHRLGYQRFDEVFERWPAGTDLPAETDAEYQERMDALFGCDAERYGLAKLPPDIPAGAR